MLKSHIRIIVTLVLVGEAYGQNWMPKYSTRGNLDYPIHQYKEKYKYNPWAIADTLILPTILNSYQMGMAINTGTTFRSTDSLFIETNSVKVTLYKQKPNLHLRVYQKIALTRKLLEIEFLQSDNSHFNSPINYYDATFNSSSGRVYFNDANTIQFRMNGDGLIFIRPHNDNIKKVKYRLSFYPGYYKSSKKIPRYGYSSEFNKEDVSHLFIDEYGGFGIYLLDNEKEDYDNMSTYPEVTYALTDEKVFWTSVFPPKTASYAKVPLIQTNWYSYVQFVDGRLQELPWSPTTATPMQTYWLVSNAKPTDLKDTINIKLPQVKNGVLIHFGDLALWKNWQFEYKPRKTLNPSKYSILNKVAENLHSTDIGMKYIVYTSPQYFLKGSKYSVKTDPYAFHTIDQLTGIDDPNYDTMRNHLNDFTFNNGAIYNYYGSSNFQIPILNHLDMLQAIRGGPKKVDLFMDATGYPYDPVYRYAFTVANREGENMHTFLQAIKDLKDSTAIDGIYMDTFYEFNIPRTYQLMRLLKQKYGNNFILFRHASGKEGQDAYLPQIDAYADYVLNGEGNYYNDYNDRKFLRFFISTQNISNSVSVLWYPTNITDTNAFINRMYDYNIRLIYPSLKSTGNPDPGTDSQFVLVNTFYSSFPTPSALESRVNSNLAFHQPSHQINYEATSGGWSYYSGFQSLSSHNLLKGDINGDNADELIIKRNNVYYFYSRNSNLNGQSRTLGASTDKPFIGDFNGDLKSDIMLMNSNLASVYLSASTSNGVVFPTTPSFTSPLPPLLDASAKIMVMKFNNDRIYDVLTYKNSVWKVYLGWGTGFNGTPAVQYPWGNFDDVPLVGDFNGDNLDDIALYRTSGGSAEWFFSFSNGTTFVNTPYLHKGWGNKTGDDPLIGRFDENFNADIMIHRRSAYPNWYVALSNWAQYKVNPSLYPFDFIDSYPWWSQDWGNLGNYDIPIILDFNGDGVDDKCIYRLNLTTTNIFIDYTKPGEIESSLAGTLPKRGTSEETESGLPVAYSLRQNYPNPFNPTTNILFELPRSSKVKLAIYDVKGREVDVLIEDVRPAGRYAVPFNGSGLASGIYLYMLKADGFKDCKKMTLIR